MKNQKMEKVIKDHSFLLITQNFDFNNNQEVYENIKNSSVIIISQYEEENEKNDNKYFIFGFKRTLISIKQSSVTLIGELLSINPNRTFYFLKDTEDIFKQLIKIEYKRIDSQPTLDEIEEFSKSIYNSNKNNFFSKFYIALQHI